MSEVPLYRRVAYPRDRPVSGRTPLPFGSEGGDPPRGRGGVGEVDDISEIGCRGTSLIRNTQPPRTTIGP